MSAGTFIAASIFIDAMGDPVLSGRFDDLLPVANIQIEPVTQSHALLARSAYRSFEKETGHQAQLNFGDCFAYAWLGSNENLFCSKETISLTPTLSLHWKHDRLGAAIGTVEPPIRT